jgi:hypothetical protein
VKLPSVHQWRTSHSDDLAMAVSCGGSSCCFMTSASLGCVGNLKAAMDAAATALRAKSATTVGTIWSNAMMVALDSVTIAARHPTPLRPRSQSTLIRSQIASAMAYDSPERSRCIRSPGGRQRNAETYAFSGSRWRKWRGVHGPAILVV